MEHGGGGRRSKKSHLEIRSKSDPSNFPNIPEEIVLDILSRIRLPHDFFCRLRCVSKQWSTLISDSNLITLSKRQKIIVMYQMYESRSFTFQSIDQQCYVEKVQTPWENNLDLHYTEVHIYGSCNGLFLLGIKGDLYLWNPLNGYFKKVFSYHRLTTLCYSITSGLCYDSSTKGYKAVMVFPPLNPCDDKLVMVGDFRRKHWKEVCFPSNTRARAIHSGPVLNGQLHWFVRNAHSVLNRCIFSFDPRVDEFKKIPMPKLPKDRNKFILLGLGVLDGCLCMIRNHQRSNQVWVMEAYGVQKSWNIRFVISSTFMNCSIMQPLCCTKNGEVLMREPIGSDDGLVSLYNSNGDYCRVVQRPSICQFPKVAMAYEESLVEPTDYMWENEERRGIATYVEHFLSASPRKMIKGKESKDDSKWNYLDPKEED